MGKKINLTKIKGLSNNVPHIFDELVKERKQPG